MDDTVFKETETDKRIKISKFSKPLKEIMARSHQEFQNNQKQQMLWCPLQCLQTAQSSMGL